MGMATGHAADQLRPHDDVPPLVRPSHLQHRAVAPVQFEKVVGLQQHVVEFEEAQRLLPFQAQAHAVHGQHAVDAEMPADIAQEGDVAQPIQPFGIVEHQRAGVEIQQRLEGPADADLVGLDDLIRQQLPGIILAGGIAHLGGAAADQRDGPAAGLLEEPQQHRWHEVADMQAVRRAVIADIGREPPLVQRGIQLRLIRGLVDVAAFLGDAQEVAGDGHGGPSSAVRVFPGGARRSTLGGCCKP